MLKNKEEKMRKIEKMTFVSLDFFLENVVCVYTVGFIFALEEHLMILKHIFSENSSKTFYAIKVNSTPKRTST